MEDKRVKQVTDFYIGLCKKQAGEEYEVDEMDFTLTAFISTHNCDLFIISFYEHGEGPGGVLYAYFHEEEMVHIILEYDTIIDTIYKMDQFTKKVTIT